MTKKFETEKKLSPQELAAQLRKPEGEPGVDVGLQMNEANEHISLNTYRQLQAMPGEHILEIGMGNGHFVKDLFLLCPDLWYTGVDYSGTMVHAARELNATMIKNGNVNFEEASIDQLPVEDASIDGVVTANTIYFWPNPMDNARELIRVLKNGGRAVIAYRSTGCMDELEFTKYGFEKYAPADVESLLSSAGFSSVRTTKIPEPEVEFEGQLVSIDGYYTIGFKL